MDFNILPIPYPLALAIIATIGYMVGRWDRADRKDASKHSMRELTRARTVAMELEKITMTVRKSLSRHNSSMHKFRERVDRINELHQETAWRELCREADEILKPTLELASQIADACDEIRQQSVKLMSIADVRTDPLTGVKNRRGLDDSLAAQFALFFRYKTPFTAAIFDIDNFKQINEEHGHLRGDQVLLELAKLLAESVRETDIVVRYGDREFVIIMPETELAGASIFCERLRETIERRLILRVSGGVAAAEIGDSQETLLARADAAVARARAAGRNCVFAHSGTAITFVNSESPVAAV